MENQKGASLVHPSVIGIAPKELQERMQRGETPQLVDVREWPEFASGHIDAARLIPLGELRARSEELDRNSPVVCICRSGVRSAQAAQLLQALGFERVYQLVGGVLAWGQAGLPLVGNARARWVLERQVRLAFGIFLVTGLALSQRWPAAILICWIIGIGMVVTAIVDWCGMALILGKAPWNRESVTARGRVGKL